MKLKSQPEDFCVDEQTEVRPGNGAHAFYRLSKCGMGTPEALAEILRKWDIPRNKLSYGGLKDRHAKTTQHISIFKGPTENLADRSFALEYLGQISRPFDAKDIFSNRFAIRLRNIPQSKVEAWSRSLEQARQHGVINYFDDQRFGSIGFGGELIGACWCVGNYERALYLALAEPNMHDRPRERDQKEILRANWGNWQKCKDLLDRSHRRSVVTYLVDHPTDFKRALALIRIDLRSIYTAAFQSWVWNRWLSKLIAQVDGRADELAGPCLPSRCGKLALPELNTPDAIQRWASLTSSPLPLPSARQHDWPPGTLEPLQEVMRTQNMEVREMRFKFPRDTFFSRGMRDIVLWPMNLASHWEQSETAKERMDWCLQFELPRGAYATMVIRQITRDDNDWVPDEGTDSETDQCEMNDE